MSGVTTYHPFFVYFFQQNLTSLNTHGRYLVLILSAVRTAIEAVCQDGAVMPEIEAGPGDIHDTLSLFPCCNFGRFRNDIKRKMHARIRIQPPSSQVSSHEFVTAPTTAEVDELIRRYRFFWREGVQFFGNPSFWCGRSQFGTEVCERERSSGPRVVRQTNKEGCVNSKLVRCSSVYQVSAVRSRNT